MKKIIFTFILMWSMAAVTNAQNGLNIGGSIGFPVNGSNYDFTFGFTGDINYLFEVHPGFSVGPATGYGIGFGDEYYRPIIGDKISVIDYQYVPIAIAGRHYASDKIVGGTDIGYAIALTDDDYFGYRGGFYLRPMIGYNLTENLQINLNYVGVWDYFYWSTINFGVTLNLN